MIDLVGLDLDTKESWIELGKGSHQMRGGCVPGASKVRNHMPPIPALEASQVPMCVGTVGTRCVMGVG